MNFMVRDIVKELRFAVLTEVPSNKVPVYTADWSIEL
jgi:hypothetical protein